MNPDRLAELEDERRFLLRSLRDLDAELAAGDVDRADYDTLRDGYTKRAADVLRDIEEGKAALPLPPERRWPRRLAVVAAVVLVAAGGGWFVARSSGQRLADDEITGGVPRDTAELLAQARALLGVDARGAQALYEQVLSERPDHPEALTYSAWLLFTASSGASEDLRAAAVDAAKEQLGRAVAADASYPDPHCFLAVIAANADDDAAMARAEIDQCLALDPPVEIRALVEQFAARLETPPTTT